MKQEMQQMRGSKLKVPLPDQFDGTRSKLKNFLAQADTYLKYNGHLLPQESDKVTLIGSRLTGTAFNFYQPYYQDFMKYPIDQQEDATKDIFGDYDIFKDRLNKFCGNIDEKREAERKIVRLRQNGSAQHYVSEFQQLMGQLNWADGPAIAQFYQGLKDEVKDQFMLIERPKEIQDMQMKAVEIDNRLYERRLEKQGRHTTLHQKEKKTWGKRQPSTATGTHAGPMEIDQINKKEQKKKERKPLNDQQKKWLEQKACLKCGQQGHWANNCGTKQVNMVRKDAEEQQRLKHALTHWTTCYDDGCETHRTSKDNNGWYPQKVQELDQEEQEYREWQHHNSLSGRRCHKKDCDIPHHKEWSEEREAQEKEARHQALDAKECIRNHCEHHGTKQVAKVSQRREVTDTETIPYLETKAIINGRVITAIIDSGSHGNFIDPATIKELGLQWGGKTYPYRVTGADGSALGQTGLVAAETVPITYTIKKEGFVDTFDILPMASHRMMLGMPWLKKYNPYVNWTKGTIHFGLEPPEGNRAVMQVTKVEELPTEYQNLKEVFRETEGPELLPEHQEWDHTIPLREGTKPTMEQIRKMDENQAKILREYLETALKKGWIRESTSSAGYPILFVKKKDGGWRTCIDYRRLNDITMKDSHPLPLISEIQDRLTGAVIFTKLDIKDAYHQVRIKEGEEWKTAFRTRYGTFEYQVMPFGLTNAPASFQRLINTALKDYLDIFCTAYLDDIIVFSRTKEEHTEHVRKVLQRLLRWNLRLKITKCEFGVTKTEFLGHILEPGRLSMDPAKIESILTWPEPRTVKEVQSFLGLGNYYRKFIRDYSKIATPLTNIAKTGQEFKWEKEQGKAFETLKEAFTTAPVLRLYDPKRPIIIETDASDYAIGACLNQLDEEGRAHPVLYFSRKLIPAEINYDVHDKELMAIVAAMREWDVYVNSNEHEIQVFTDHKNLQTFLTTKELTRRHMRWAERLGHIKFRIIYRRGSENARADALSRRVDYKPDTTQQSYQLLKEEPDGSLVYANPQVMQIYKVSQEVDQELIDAYQKDSMYAELKKRATTEHQIHESAEGYLRFFGKVYVPARQVNRIIRQQHDAPGAGHQGFKRTHDRMKNYYYFPKMKQRIREHIDTCVECITNKPNRHRPYGEMGEYRIPTEPFGEIAMDWIVKLPKSKDPLTHTKYDSIMVIVDRLTKYAKFVPYLEASSTEALAHSFMKHIIAEHGMPKAIISDRDKWITSNFWQSLMKRMGSMQIMTSAYHPQANGQAERLNQTLEQYLRHYLNEKQDNWVELLPIAQYAYNSATSEPTGVTPFEALFGRTPTIYHEPLPDEKPAANAQRWTQEAKDIQEQLGWDLKFQQIQMAKYYNKDRLSAPILRKGEKVFLLRRNIKTKRPSDKLDHLKIGPFKIGERLGNTHYRLELPSQMRIHPVFHIALLEPAPAKLPLAKNIEVESENDIYDFERIMDHRKSTTGKGLEYLVKWKGYSNNESTWEPAKNFNDHHIKQYHQYLETVNRTNHREGPFQGTRKAQEKQQDQRTQDHLPVHRVLMIRRGRKWNHSTPRPSPPLPPASQPPQSTPTLSQTGSSPSTLRGSPLSAGEDDEKLGQVSAPSNDESQPPHPSLHFPPQLSYPLPSVLAFQDYPLEKWLGTTEKEEAQQKLATILQAETAGMQEKERIELEIKVLEGLYTKLANTYLETKDPEIEDECEMKLEVITQARIQKISYLQSLRDTTRSQERPRETHSEQRPEERSTRQREPRVRQEEQGVGISAPGTATAEVRSMRRSREDFGRRPMMNETNKREELTTGWDTHYLYPPGPSTGYRDAILEEGGVVLRAMETTARIIGQEETKEQATTTSRGATWGSRDLSPENYDWD
jgi:hypothetical protein